MTNQALIAEIEALPKHTLAALKEMDLGCTQYNLGVLAAIGKRRLGEDLEMAQAHAEIAQRDYEAARLADPSYDPTVFGAPEPVSAKQAGNIMDARREDWLRAWAKIEEIKEIAINKLGSDRGAGW